MSRSHSRPSYRGGDPARRLLAAVVLQAVRDCSRQVSPGDREEAQSFLNGEEGAAWLQALGVSANKAQEFVNNGHQIMGEAQGG